MAFISVPPYPLHVGEIATFVLSISLTTLAVSARLYTKFYLTKLMKWEDYFCLVGWLGFLAHVGLAIAAVHFEGDVLYASYLKSVDVTLYGPVLVLIKISILLQYISIFAPHRQGWFYICALCLIIINVLFYTTTMLLVIFQCTPRQSLWDPTIPGHCVDRHMFQLPASIVDIVSDFTILLLPLPLIWRLQITTKKKLGVCAIFGVGLFACMASIGCLVTAISLLRMSDNDMDVPFALDGMGLWYIAEEAAVILVGCLPILPKFFQQFSRTKKSPLYKPNPYAEIGKPSTQCYGIKAPDCNNTGQPSRSHWCISRLNVHGNTPKLLASHFGLHSDSQPVIEEQLPVMQRKSILVEDNQGLRADRDLEEWPLTRDIAEAAHVENVGHPGHEA